MSGSQSFMQLLHFTSAECFGITVLDPVTIITNAMIFGVGLYCYRKLDDDQEMYHLQWRWFFMLIGIAALIGVPVHGFSNYLGNDTTLFLWLVMGLTQGLGATFAQLATFRRWSDNYDRWRYLPVIQFAVFCLGFLYFKSYEAVKIHLALSLVPVMVYNFILYRRGELSSLWISCGIFVASLTAFVHSFKLSISEWMNYNDISHLLIVASLLLTDIGFRRIEPVYAISSSEA